MSSFFFAFCYCKFINSGCSSLGRDFGPDVSQADMYRAIVPVLLYMGTTAGAPPDNSDITYVKIQPITNQDPENIPHPRPQFRESRIENIPLTIRGYNVDDKEPKFSRHIRSDEFTTFAPFDSEEATDSTESATENTSLEEVINTDEYEVSQKPLIPRFYSKLSYFRKANEYNRPISTNLVDTHPWRRKFKSRCRCEKISNCPKLQISVGRCPEEYFLCCF